MNVAPNENNEASNYRINNNKTTENRSFEYKTEMTGSTSANNNRLDPGGVALLKYLSNFWRSLGFPLINCEIELDLSCSKDYAISEISRTRKGAADPAANPPTDHVLPAQTILEHYFK